MIETVTNTESFADREILRTLGLVTGSSVRGRHVGSDLMSAVKNLVGGELVSYTELMNQTRTEAMQRMFDEAEKLGANAVVNVRFVSTSITTGAAEVCVSGTAVLVGQQLHVTSTK